MLRFRVFLFAVVLISTILSGCVNEKDETAVLDQPTTVSGIAIGVKDSIWNIVDNAPYTISIRVEGGGRVDSIWVEIQADSSYRFSLADDGGNDTLFTGHSWLLSNSGDQVPHDGLWTRRLRSGFAPIGSYPVHYFAKLGETIWQLTTHWQVVSNFAPQITNISAPDTLFSGTEQSLLVTVVDPDTLIQTGITSITGELFKHTPTDSSRRKTFSFEPLGGNQQWRFTLRDTFALNLHSDWYKITATATDLFGAIGKGSDTIWIENKPPHIDTMGLTAIAYGPGLTQRNAVRGLTAVLWDSLGRDDVDSVLITFRVFIDDPQSARDVISMRFDLSRTMRGDTVIYSRFGTRKNPVTGDSIDGVWYGQMPSLNATNRPGGPGYRRPPFDTYFAVFTAMDGGGNVSEIDTLTFNIVPDTLAPAFYKRQSTTPNFHQSQSNLIRGN